VFFAAAALIIVGVALFVAAPLGSGLIAQRRKSAAELDLMRLEHERGLAVQGLRELEFDREMGKLSTADFESLHAALENRALAAMGAIEKLRTPAARPAVVLLTPAAAVIAEPAEPQPARKESPALATTTAPLRIVPPRDPEHPAAQARTVPLAEASATRPESPRPAARSFRFCPRCGARAAADSNYCAECGTGLRSAIRATRGTD